MKHAYAEWTRLQTNFSIWKCDLAATVLHPLAKDHVQVGGFYPQWRGRRCVWKNATPPREQDFDQKCVTAVLSGLNY